MSSLLEINLILEHLHNCLFKLLQYFPVPRH